MNPLTRFLNCIFGDNNISCQSLVFSGQKNQVPTDFSKKKLFFIVFIFIALGVTLVIASKIYLYNQQTQIHSLNSTNKSLSLPEFEKGISDVVVTTTNQSYMSFDGINDYIHTSKNVTDLGVNQNLTISIWLNIEGLHDGWIVSDRSGNNFFSIDLRDSENKLYVRSRNGTSWHNSFIADTSIKIYDWLHLVGVYNGTHTSIWINGTHQHSIAYYGSIFSSKNLTIGARPDSVSTEPFKGLVDEIRIYNTSLTSSQITEIYNSGRIPNSSLPNDGLVLWYHFNENNGTVVNDISGNGNNAQ